MSQALSAACRWSCFILVRLLNSLNCIVSYGFMPVVGLIFILVWFLSPPCFCPTPFGVLLTFTLFEFSRRHLWSVTSPFWALADGCFCLRCGYQYYSSPSRSFWWSFLLPWSGNSPYLVCRSDYPWFHALSLLYFLPLGVAHLPIARILPPLVLDIFCGFMQVFLLYSGKVHSIPWIVLSLPVPCYMPFTEGYSYICYFSNPMILPNSIRDLLTLFLWVL